MIGRGESRVVRTSLLEPSSSLAGDSSRGLSFLLVTQALFVGLPYHPPTAGVLVLRGG